MKKLESYPKTDKFKIIDTIGVPHPFCVTEKHIIFAADNYSGRLSNTAIENYEKKTKRPSCGIRGCNLMFNQHEQALLVEVDSKEKLNEVEGLKEYLESCVDQCKKDGFAGFSFIRKEN